MPEITSPDYKRFIDGKTIQTIPPEDLKIILDNIDHEHTKQARALVIMLWATGARPNEVLRLRGIDITKKTHYLDVDMPGSKGGTPRTIKLKLRGDILIRELWEYIQTIPAPIYLFYEFRSKRVRHGATYTTRKRQPDGTIQEITKTTTTDYEIITDKLNYYFKKWSKALFPDGIPPYYLRHNRCTVLAEQKDITAAEIAHLRGSSIASTERYIHMTERQAKKIARHLTE